MQDQPRVRFPSEFCQTEYVLALNIHCKTKELYHSLNPILLEITRSDLTQNMSLSISRSPDINHYYLKFSCQQNDTMLTLKAAFEVALAGIDKKIDVRITSGPERYLVERYSNGTS